MDPNGSRKRKKVLGITADSRRTCQLVLDEKTIQRLIKMRNRGIFSQIHLDSAVSSGKEASVFYASVHNNPCESLIHFPKKGVLVEEALNAMAPCENCPVDVIRPQNLPVTTLGDENTIDMKTLLLAERAVKVFGTSVISKFKKRSDYVIGDHRLETGYNGKNPRKKVKQWAEKEYRNLKRLTQAGLRSPMPLDLRDHTLAMTFLGEDRVAAPRLKDVVGLSPLSWSRLYVEVIVSMRAIYHDCCLVHGDFSEYNILLFRGHPYIIDVSQSVDCTEHEGAFNFLKRDCINITRFFRQRILGGQGRRRGAIALGAEEFQDEDEIAMIPTSLAKDHDIVLNLNKSVGANKNYDATHIAQQDLAFGTTLQAFRLEEMLTSEELFRVIVTKRLPKRVEAKYNEIRSSMSTQSTTNQPLWPVYDDGVITFNENGDAHPEPITPLRSDHQGDFEVSAYPLSQNEFYYKRSVADSLCVAIVDHILCREKTATEDGAKARGARDIESDLRSNEEIFLNTDIPKSLNVISDEVIADELKMLQLSRTQVDLIPELIESQSSSDDEEGNEDGRTSIDTENPQDDDSDDIDSNLSGPTDRFNGQIPDSMSPKDWKKKVKEEQRAKRSEKRPKHIKKRKDRKRHK